MDEGLSGLRFGGLPRHRNQLKQLSVHICGTGNATRGADPQRRQQGGFIARKDVKTGLGESLEKPLGVLPLP